MLDIFSIWIEWNKSIYFTIVNCTGCTMNFVRALLWLNTLEFEAKNGQNPFGWGVFTSQHALRFLIFRSICPADFFQNFKSDLAFLGPGAGHNFYFFKQRKSYLEYLPSCIWWQIFLKNLIFEKSLFLWKNVKISKMLKNHFLLEN